MKAESAPKWRKTMIEKYGSEEKWKEHQKMIARRGGSAHVAKGFSVGTPEERKERSRQALEAKRRNSIG